jgi:hypothetical protein
MSAPNSGEVLRVERLLAMAQRLIEALESDVSRLKAGNARGLRTVEPEIQKLSALYGREAASLSPAAAQKVPHELRKRLFETTGRFRDLLAAQTRLLMRLRGASEGMVRAVAEEIERQRAPLRGYGASPTPRAGGAILFNSVV